MIIEAPRSDQIIKMLPEIKILIEEAGGVVDKPTNPREFLRFTIDGTRYSAYCDKKRSISINKEAYDLIVEMYKKGGPTG